MSEKDKLINLELVAKIDLLKAQARKAKAEAVIAEQKINIDNNAISLKREVLEAVNQEIKKGNKPFSIEGFQNLANLLVTLKGI